MQRIEGVFPGRISRLPVIFTNHFASPVRIFNLSSTDPRVSIQLTKTSLFPSERAQVGVLFFDPLGLLPF